MHQFVLIITLAIIAIIIASFWIVIANTRQTADGAEIQDKANTLRPKVIWFMIGIGAPLTLALAYEWPHDASALGGNPIVVKAVSGQWYWDIDKLELPAATPIVFELTSVDVNHGFGLYDSDWKLVGQAQAMPGYTNKLNFVFEKAGVYTVACLEYCGVAHHAMLTEIEVVDPTTYAANQSEEAGE